MARPQFILGDFAVEPDQNRLTRGDAIIEIEPKVMDLLVYFAGREGQVVPKSDIAAALWPDVEVNDDALTRTVWKLRRALGDEARSPRYIETVPKRGYRLLAAVSPSGLSVETTGGEEPERNASAPIPMELLGLAGVLLAAIALVIAMPLLTGEGRPETDAGRAAMLQRADAFYAQYTRSDNEAALRLYETVLASHPDDAAAMAGLSNAVAQRTLRFTGPGGAAASRSSLTEALETGWLDSPEAEPAIDRAVALARQATEADPGHARAWRALGLALSMQRDFQGAEAAYNRALVIQPDSWGALINLSDISTITGNEARALDYLERAYDAMSQRYSEDAVLVRPWQSQVGLLVAERRREAGDLAGAESWYRRVLAGDPLNREGVSGLAALLRESGDGAGADALCEDLERRTGEGCGP
jgi:transcriptional activator of cad operon